MIKRFKENSPFNYFDSQNLIAIDYEVDEYNNPIKLEDKFDHHLLNVLSEETLVSIKFIDQLLRPDLEGTVSIVKVNNILDILYSLNKSISGNLPLKIKDIIHLSLVEIIRHIFTEYKMLRITHPSRHLIRNNKSIDTSFSYFGAVRENFKFYRELHTILYDNDIIPESDEDDDIFFELLISENHIILELL